MFNTDQQIGVLFPGTTFPAPSFPQLPIVPYVGLRPLCQLWHVLLNKHFTETTKDPPNISNSHFTLFH